MPPYPSRPAEAPVLLIGAMRSGTTLLHRLLTLHPEVCGARAKEPDVFTREGSRLPGVQTFDDAFAWEPGHHRVALDASASYATWPLEPDVPATVQRAGLQPRILYLVRDPLERILGHYQAFAGRPGFSLSKPLTRPELLWPSRYGSQLRHFLATFPDRSRYRVIDFDTLQADPFVTAKRTLEFLGLDPVKLPPDAARIALQHLAGAGGPRGTTPPAGEWRAPPRRLAWVPSPIRRLVPPMLRPGARPPPRRHFTPQEEAEARKVLAEDLRGFREQWGVDPAKWGL